MLRSKRIRSILIGVSLLLLSLVLGGWTVRVVLAQRGLSVSSLYNDAMSAIEAPSGPITVQLAATPSLPSTATPEPPSPPTVDPATLSAASILMIDLESGETLYEHQPDLPLAPASTVKIMTALTVIRHAGPEEVVTILEEDLVDPVQESSMGLRAGDTVTVQDLLVGLLLPSGNDAGKALARFVGERLAGEGAPQARFVAEMNAVASSLGMTSSHFVNPSGDDAEGQVATARDLAIAARALLEQRSLLRIVSLARTEVRVGGPLARVISIENTNELLADEGIFGVKTGTTPAAGQCLVVAHRGYHRSELVVILGSQQRYVDARALLGIDAEAGP